MVAKQRNDAKDSELGNDYRTLVALSYCIKLEKGERIVIEKYGDISLFGQKSSKQIEVKHHISPNPLGDGHEELWNTLYNWHIEDTSIFDDLVLHTTSHLSSKSSLKFWHQPNYDADKRHYTLQHGCKSNAEEYKKYHALIFNDIEFPIDKRKEIVSKITLSTSQPNYDAALNILKDNPFFSWIKGDELKVIIINKLLGEINALKKPQTDWVITRDIFDAFVQDIKYKYDKSPSSLILDAQLNHSPQKIDKNSYHDKQFVKAIECINCEADEIDDAIVDYWRFNMAFVEFLGAHPTFNNTTYMHYKDQIIHPDLMRHSRVEKSINTNLNKQLLSQIIYRKAIMLPIKEFGLLSPNSDYFQRGTMHDIVEDGKFKWKLD